MKEVTCALIFKERLILATRRSAHMSLPGQWEFPGGKIEPGETHRQCIKREIREELGIEITLVDELPSHIHDYGDFQIRLSPFTALWHNGEIVLREHDEYQWLGIQDLLGKKWAAADQPIVNKLVNGDIRIP